jgi:hypothetical protein
MPVSVYAIISEMQWVGYIIFARFGIEMPKIAFLIIVLQYTVNGMPDKRAIMPDITQSFVCHSLVIFQMVAMFDS